jgi:hypothetical protein
MARRRYRGPIKIHAYLIGGPWDGHTEANIAGMLDPHDGCLRVPTLPADDPIDGDRVPVALMCLHVYKPTDKIGRYVHAGWEIVETQR